MQKQQTSSSANLYQTQHINNKVTSLSFGATNENARSPYCFVLALSETKSTFEDDRRLRELTFRSINVHR